MNKTAKICVLSAFFGAWLITGIVFFSTQGCNYSKMPMREVTEDYRFYTFKLKQDQILCVHLAAQHKQDLTWAKDNEDYDIVSIDKVYRKEGGGRGFSAREREALKIYIQPKRSFLLNWTYKTDENVTKTLYTKIEIE